MPKNPLDFLAGIGGVKSRARNVSLVATTTPAKLLDQNSRRKSALVQNVGAVTVWVGPVGASFTTLTTEGTRIYPDDALEIDDQDELGVVAETGTCRVNVREVSEV